MQRCYVCSTDFEVPAEPALGYFVRGRCAACGTVNVLVPGLEFQSTEAVAETPEGAGFDESEPIPLEADGVEEIAVDHTAQAPPPPADAAMEASIEVDVDSDMMAEPVEAEAMLEASVDVDMGEGEFEASPFEAPVEEVPIEEEPIEEEPPPAAPEDEGPSLADLASSAETAAPEGEPFPEDVSTEVDETDRNA
jgi:hypothetical protein